MVSSADRMGINQLIEFVVDPGQQAQLITALTEQAERLTCTYPGFISATVQVSDDGRRVIQQVQWRSRYESEQALRNAETAGDQDFTAMLRLHRVRAVSFSALQVMSHIGSAR